jgi:hypothetical protein
MKKLMLVLFLMAVLCVPCYGGPAIHDILVYKFTCQLNPWIDFNDADPNIAMSVGTKQITGYCVLDVDVDSDTGGLNADPTLIFYGGTGKNKWGVNFDLEIKPGAEDDVGMEFEIFTIAGRTPSTGILVFVDEEDEHPRVGAFYVPLYGKLVSTDIGRGVKNKALVPTSLKGTIEEWAETGDVFEAFGTITVTLDSKYTKGANKPGAEITQGGTVGMIIKALTKQGYPFPT